MGYDRGDSVPFDFEPNALPFGYGSKGKLSPRSYPIQFERKWKYSFLSVDSILKICAQNNLFRFDDKTYLQIGGALMGGCVSPMLANLFLSHHEKNWPDEYR